MSVLLDTNILTRYCEPIHPHHKPAMAALTMLRGRGEQLFIVAQNLYEFWVVATRPGGENGLGLTTQEASAVSQELRGLFPFLDDPAVLFPTWERLIIENDVKGKSAHDARLVAAMKVHGIESILTFNARDFVRYSGITVLDAMEWAENA